MYCPTCEDVLITPPSNLDYYKVIITDEVTGCIDSLNLKVRKQSTCEQSKENLGIPNVFSPNGDDVNDHISLFAPAFEEIRYFRVYTRWGELVFESRDFNFQWDGTHKKKVLNPGVYAYILVAVCPDNGDLVTKTGDITVLR